MPTEVEADRVPYVFNQQPEDTDRLWKLLIDVVRPQASAVLIDGYPSPDWDDFSRLPESAQSAHEIFRELAWMQERKAGSYINLDLDPRDESQWVALREFGSHSINVEVWAEDEEDQILINHDSGGLWARLSVAERRTLTVKGNQAGIPIDEIIEVWHPRPSLWKRLWHRTKERS